MPRSSASLLAIGALAFTAVLSVTLYAIGKPKLFGGLCQIGLPNFSRPQQMPADALGCVIVGEQETIAGTLISTDFGASLRTGFKAEPIALDFRKGSSEIARQVATSWARNCVKGATVQLTGWRSLSRGQFGHMASASQIFFVERVDHVEPLSHEFVLRVRDRTWCHED